MFVMLVFAFLAIAGVAIDMGMANLTQQQMQVAVDTAALEGLRLRDTEPYEHESDSPRRKKAQQIIRFVFDDDLHPTGVALAIDDPEDPPSGYDGPDDMNMGAGPAIQAPGEIGEQRIITPQQQPVWDDPVLRKNIHNKRYGDMVSGRYRAGASSAEFEGYVRPDFEVDEALDPSQIASQLGFLVRMRRTTGFTRTIDPITGAVSTHPNTYDLEPEVSYHARPLPFLFSLGSLIQQPASGDQYDPRQEGISVRATAIAVARPALRASPQPLREDGTAYPNESRFNQDMFTSGGGHPLPMLGLHPFALSVEFWVRSVQADTWHDQVKFSFLPGGDLQDIDTGQIVGTFADHPTSVGQEIVPIDLSPEMLNQTTSYEDIDRQNQFVAIYDMVPGEHGDVRRVIGYGYCYGKIAPDQLTFFSGFRSVGTAGEYSTIKVLIAANCASARLDSTAPNLTAAEWEYVFARNKFLAYGPCEENPAGEVTYDYAQVRSGTLLAATLAR